MKDNFSENDYDFYQKNIVNRDNKLEQQSSLEGSFSSISSNANESTLAVRFENPLQLFAHIRQLAQ